MAWPRLKSPRSSAQPSTSPQVTATPAANAESGHGQNSGISGASHTVASTSPTAPVPGTGLNGRRLRPIRFAHSGYRGTPLAGEGSAPGDYQPDNYREIPAQTSNGTADGGTGPGGKVPDGTGPVNDGLGGILGGIPTTEVPDEEPTRDLSPAKQQQQPEPPVISVTSGPSGATWNQPLTSPPRPVGGGSDEPRGSFWMTVNGLVRGPALGDNGQPRTTVRELPPDVQLRFWRYRLLIMLIAGLVFGILVRVAGGSPTTCLALGLTVAILAGIIDTVYRSRNAAYYFNGASFPGARKRTSRQLRKMRRAGYLVLHERPIPGSREMIDHLVIGPTGVYAIDSERWDRRLPVRVQNNKRLFLGPTSQKERLDHALWEAGQASERLSAALGTKVDVRAALAIYGPTIPWDIATIRNVDVFTGTSLRKYLRRRSRMREGTRRLSPQEVQTYFAAATRVLPDTAQTPTATPVG